MLEPRKLERERERDISSKRERERKREGNVCKVRLEQVRTN